MMYKYVFIILYCFIIFIPFTKGAIPGTFFWKPRLSLNLNYHHTTAAPSTETPTWQNIADGKVVLIQGYRVGLTIMAVAAGIHMSKNYDHRNPLSAYFYTNAYRWAYRYLSNLTPWLSGNAGHYYDTHKVWEKRYFYMDKFVPSWLKKLLFFVKDEEWEKEEKEFHRFSRYAEPLFRKYYRYANNFNSLSIEESVENSDSSLSQLGPEPPTSP